MTTELLKDPVKIDGEGFLKCVKENKTPSRVYNLELFLDLEIKNAICEKYNLLKELDKNDANYEFKKEIILQRFLGYDYVVAGIPSLKFEYQSTSIEDENSEIEKEGGRVFLDTHSGPITNWEEFENYKWQDLVNLDLKTLEWYNENLPEDMVLIAGLSGHALEGLTWLMGYETLCIALIEDPKLVKAVYDKVLEVNKTFVKASLKFNRVKAIWGSDDMGFKTGPLLSPDQLREYVLPMHKELAQLAHEKDVLYFLHSCGKLDLIMDDLINDVKIDAKHSFEDTIEDVSHAVDKYGKQIAIFGGIDVDFLCRSNEEEIRFRVREVLERSHSKGRYCLGTGNSVANYIPLDNYLIMLDEGRKYSLL